MSSEGTNDVVASLAASLSPVVSETPESPRTPLAVNDDAYARFLSLCNGGYTRDGFFHFFGLTGPQEHSLSEWNAPDLWKSDFGLGLEFMVFAEDIFGHQYGFVRARRTGVIKVLSPTTGELTVAPPTFEGFLRFFFLEWPSSKVRNLVQQFFATQGAGPSPFHHISYKIPPILGGDPMDVGNFELVHSVASLRIAGQVISQAKALPPGTRIRRVEIDWETGRIRLVP